MRLLSLKAHAPQMAYPANSVSRRPGCVVKQPSGTLSLTHTPNLIALYARD